jgi:murein L,D-transpeptidase YcbB/YkuD
VHSQEKTLLLLLWLLCVETTAAAVTVAVGQVSCHSWYFGFQKQHYQDSFAMRDTHSQEKKLFLLFVETTAVAAAAAFAAITVAVDGQWSYHSWYFGFQEQHYHHHPSSR